MSRILEEQHLSTSDLVNAGERGEREEQAEASFKESRPQPDEPAGGPLLPQDFVQELRGRWDRLQTGFVDEPRSAVQQADELVATAMKRLAESFSEQRSSLEAQWGRGDKVSTEDLRVALRKYRTFFQRLVAV